MSKTTQTAPYTDDLSYLQDEMNWIEARCRRIATEYRLKVITGDAEPTGRWRHHENEARGNLQEAHKRFHQSEQELRKTIDRRLKETRRTEFTLAIDQLTRIYGLDSFERTILLLAAAVAFSRRFEQLYANLEDGYSALNVEAAFNFCQLSFAERITRRSAFSGKSKLAKNDLITLDLSRRYTGPEDLLTAQIQLTSRTFGFLVGDNSLIDEFLEFSSIEEPMADFDQVVLKSDDKKRILSVVERHDEYLKYRKAWGFDDIIHYGKGILMLFHGKPGTGKTMMAHAVANKLGKRVLNVDIPTFIEHHQAERFLPSLFREARLQNALLFFDECEVIFGDRRAGNTLMTLLLTEIERFEGIAILATNLPQNLDEALDRRILVKVRFPTPDHQARQEIWQRHLPADAPLASDVELAYLAERFELTGGYIKNAVLAAVAAAVHENDEQPKITMQHLEDAARAQLRRPVDQYTETTQPKARLKDVILHDRLHEQIQELIDAARQRRTIFERWGIGQHLTFGKSISALFHGAPGTGKTLCAEAIAHELNRPLLVVSAAALKSKWVGETENNLAHLFSEAKDNDAVLFIDEVDSLLMTRGLQEASHHDHSVANMMLTQIERYDGVVLLATDCTAGLDPALERRLLYILELKAPGPRQRVQIWQTLITDQVPTEGIIDFRRLGQRYTLTGAQIKNAVFKAAFRAARADMLLNQDLLEEAAEQEQNPPIERTFAIPF